MFRVPSLYAVPLTVLLTLVVAMLLRTRVGARVVAATDAIASRPGLAIAICAAVPFIGSAAVAWLVMWPAPVVHDEFSFLLQADTFAHGRLTNPTHPMWQFFESFHIFHQPTYASKYPPAHGLLLAAGQLLGSPVIGVWIGAAMMGAALCWMLYAWVSPRWAFLTGLAAAAQVGVAKYWTQTLWGGALAAAAGALVLGAVARLAEAPRARDSLILGAGLLVLANTRPFEGALLAIVALAYLAAMSWRRSGNGATTIAPAAAVLVAGVIAMALYDDAVAGKWWKLPYVNHEEIYPGDPLWILQGPRPAPIYRHRELCLFYKDEGCGEPKAEVGTSAPPESVSAHVGALDADAQKALGDFFLGRMFLLPFAIGLLALTKPKVKLAAACAATMVVAVALSTYFRIHYVAPFTGALFALSAVGMERIGRFEWRDWPIGYASCVALLAGVAASVVLHAGRVEDIHTSFGKDDFVYRRAEVVERLRETPGRDLVIVSYGRHHDVHREWVYNGADIDASEIVWARDMGAERNRELLDYFRDRRVWRLRKGFSAEIDGLAAYAE